MVTETVRIDWKRAELIERGMFSRYFVSDGRGMFCRDCLAIVDAFFVPAGFRYAHNHLICDDCGNTDVHFVSRRVRLLARDLQQAILNQRA